MSSFLPSEYTPPKGSGDVWKPEAGENKVRILSDAKPGWVYWTDNGPRRFLKKPDTCPDAKVYQDGKVDKPRHIWLVVAGNYADNSIVVWEIAQAQIRDAIISLANDEDWGHPQEYDLKITKSGSGLETKYSVVPGKVAAASASMKKLYKASNIDLMEYFEKAPSSDPPVSPQPEPQPEPVAAGVDEPNPDDIPF